MGKKILYGFLAITAIGAFNLANEPKTGHLAAATTSSASYNSYSQPTPAKASFGCHVDMDSFNQLITGISYSMAVNILGCEGKEISRVEMSGIKDVMYSWNGSGSFAANMNASFQNDRLISRAQFGLR